MTGDSVSAGDATGAGDDLIDEGPGHGVAIGDSSGEGEIAGSGGDDVIDLGGDGGLLGLGDHNSAAGSALGAGDDKVTGGSGDDILGGDSSVVEGATAAGDDVLKGHGGNDRLLEDNSDFSVEFSFGTVRGEDRLKGDGGDDTLRAGPRRTTCTAARTPTTAMVRPGRETRPIPARPLQVSHRRRSSVDSVRARGNPGLLSWAADQSHRAKTRDCATVSQAAAFA